MQREVALARDLLTTTRPVREVLTERDVARPIGLGPKTPGWLLAHLAVSGGYGLRFLGAQPTCPSEWFDRFGPRTEPSLEAAAYPPLAELLTEMERAYAAFFDVALRTPAEAYAAANAVERMRPRYPTVGDVIAYFLTTHLAYHLGQLSAWRGQP
jgi:hypothetical protein